MKNFALLALVASQAAALQLRDDLAVVDPPAEVIVDDAPVVDEAEMVVVPEEIPAELVVEEPEPVEMVEAVNHEEIADTIDDTFAQSTGEDQVLEAEQPQPLLDNSRPPPEQNLSIGEARVRPNIFDHALLNSMDLSFVSQGFQQMDNQPSTLALLGGSYGGPAPAAYQSKPTYG